MTYVSVPTDAVRLKSRLWLELVRASVESKGRERAGGELEMSGLALTMCKKFKSNTNEIRIG